MSKEALISPIEPRETGYRVAQVVDQYQTFEVGQPLFWVECADDVVADKFWYNPDNQLIVPNPPPPPPPLPTAEENKQTAIGFLQETDWTTIPDVADPNLSNPYLSNAKAFIDYRNLIRPYTINPVAGNIDWATKPEPIWSNT
jgi:hypothetical protein